jgi:hypothetical protein
MLCRRRSGVGIPARLRGLPIDGLNDRSSDADFVVAAVTREKLTSRVEWRGESVSTRKSPFFRGTAIEVDFQPGIAVADPHEYVPVF